VVAVCLKLTLLAGQGVGQVIHWPEYPCSLTLVPQALIALGALSAIVQPFEAAEWRICCRSGGGRLACLPAADQRLG
jgi:hypothetical protein